MAVGSSKNSGKSLFMFDFILTFLIPSEIFNNLHTSLTMRLLYDFLSHLALTFLLSTLNFPSPSGYLSPVCDSSISIETDKRFLSINN